MRGLLTEQAQQVRAVVLSADAALLLCIEGVLKVMGEASRRVLLQSQYLRYIPCDEPRVPLKGYYADVLVVMSSS